MSFSFWAQADIVGKSTALLLGAMSLTIWYLIFVKGVQAWATRRTAASVQDIFWGADDMTDAVTKMQHAAPASPFTAIAVAAATAHGHGRAGGKLGDAFDLAAFLLRAIRRAFARTNARLDSGLTVLASIGATAPFVGLFGTVWGIYHALAAIGISGESTIDKVAGPVGEALIMTALGIAVAVPAVLGYNALARANRLTRAELDAYAQELHAYLTADARPRTNAACTKSCAKHAPVVIAPATRTA